METIGPKIECMPAPGAEVNKSARSSKPVGTVNSMISPYNSLIMTWDESQQQLSDIAPEMRSIAEKVFNHLDETIDNNVFLNVPNLIQLLILLATISHAQPSTSIKKLLLRFQKKKLSERDKYPLTNSEIDRLVCTRASRDLTAWDLSLRNQCCYNEYQTRRRLYVNQQACRSYSFRTFQALNNLLMEIKISSGTNELDSWAMGMEQFPTGTKNFFQVWDYEHAKQEEGDKKMKKTPLPSAIKGKLQVNIRDQKIPTGHKCPILMSATHFEIPVHPFIMDMGYNWKISIGVPSPIRCHHFINDMTKMLKYFKIGTDHRAIWIPCRVKEEKTNMQLMVFWCSQESSRYYSVMSLVEAVVNGQDTTNEYNGKIEQLVIDHLFLPMWERSTEATNLALPIATRITDHLFTEGGFGDLAQRNVRPTFETGGQDVPSIQAFDHLVIRTPNQDAPKMEVDSEETSKPGVVRVSLPYYLVVYDDSVKCPIYTGRITRPLLESDSREESRNKWTRLACTIL